MQIYIKIGTMPAQYMHLCRKRKEPVMGETIYVKEVNKRWYKSQRVVVDEIRSVGGGCPLYYAYRM